MNRTQTVELITYFNRAGLVGAMEGQSAVWADALADIRSEDAQTVAREIVRTRTSSQRWLTPGDIREAVHSLRATRVHRAPPVTAPDPDNGIEWRKVWTQLLSDGYHPIEAYRHACAHVGDEPDTNDLRFLSERLDSPASIEAPPTDGWMQRT